MRLISLFLVIGFCITIVGCSLLPKNSKEVELNADFASSEQSLEQGFADKEQTEDKEDAELEKFRNMSQAEIETEIFGPAETLYAMFDSTTLYCDANDTLTVDGMTYTAVKSAQPELDSSVDFSIYENFKNYTKTIFSDEFTDKLFKDSIKYVNYNGKLYAVSADRGNDIYYNSRTFAVTKVEKDKIEYTIYAKYIREEYSEDYFNGKWDNTTVPEYALETKEYIYPREKINGKWVFTTFCSVY